MMPPTETNESEMGDLALPSASLEPVCSSLTSTSSTMIEIDSLEVNHNGHTKLRNEQHDQVIATAVDDVLVVICNNHDIAEEQNPPPITFKTKPCKTMSRKPPNLKSSSNESDVLWHPTTTVKDIFHPGIMNMLHTCTNNNNNIYNDNSGNNDNDNSNNNSNNNQHLAIIPVVQLRNLASQGSLDCSHRGLSWRILLGYLPADSTQWNNVTNQQRRLYQEFITSVFVHPMDIGAELKQQPRRRGRREMEMLLSSDSSLASATSSFSDRSLKNDDESCIITQSTRLPSVATAFSKPSPPEVNDIPVALQDAWQRSGRDVHVLKSVCSGINALKIPFDCSRSCNGEISSNDNESLYDSFILTAVLLDEIRKDVVRTCCDMAFYLDPVLGMRRYAVLERILLIWATFNKSVRYVQGMNEIVAVLYFVLTSYDEVEEEEDFDNTSCDDKTSNGLKSEAYKEQRELDSMPQNLTKFECLNPNDDGANNVCDISLDKMRTENIECFVREHVLTIDWADSAEPDTFWLFHSLLTEVSDVFVPCMDNEETGIQGRIIAMQDLLKRHDSELMEHMKDIGIDSGFYSVRWLTTLLSREFHLPDTIRLWDSMFASTHKDNFIRYVCVTMVLVIRDKLLKADFSTCLRMLQSYPPVNMEQLLQSSRALWIYESQITLACRRAGISLAQALSTIAPPPGIVFAFGLRYGIIYQSERENQSVSTSFAMTEQKVREAELKVREATQVVGKQAQRLFGRARGLYSRSIQEYRKYRSNSESDRSAAFDTLADTAAISPITLPEEEEGEDDEEEDPKDVIYMQAILNS